MSAGPTTDDGRTMYCRRCDDAVRVIRPWRGWKAARNAWYVVMCLMVLLFPVMAADYCVMIPTMMLMIIAGSPLHAFAREKPVCRRCSLELDEGAREAGTGVRARPREPERR